MTDTNQRDWYMRWVEALNTRQFDVLEEFMDERLLVNGQETRREDSLAAFSEVFDAVPDIQWEIAELVFAGDGVAVKAISTGTPAGEWLGAAATGKSFTMVEYVICKIRDGRFVEMTGLQDVSEMHRQLAA